MKLWITNECGFYEKGFTFVEILVYMGVLTMMLIGIGGTARNIIVGGERASVVEEVSANSRFALNRITEAVREAESINSPSIGESSSTLSLKVVDPEKDPTIFTVSDESLTIRRGGEEAVDITSREIKVSDLEFINISYPDTPGTVFVRFTLSYDTSSLMQEYEAEKSFQTTVNLFSK